MINFIKRGFTLIELLIVIAIIGILTALITTNLQGARSRARDTRRKSDLRAIEQSLRLYYNDNKRFPAGIAPNWLITGCNGTECSWGGPFTTGTTIYMSLLPTDPSYSTSNPKRYYYSSPSDDSMLLATSLENASDPDIAESQARCASQYTLISSVATPTDYLICAE